MGILERNSAVRCQMSPTLRLRVMTFQAASAVAVTGGSVDGARWMVRHLISEAFFMQAE